MIRSNNVNIGRSASKSVEAEDDESNEDNEDEDEDDNIHELLECLRGVIQRLMEIFNSSEYSDRSTAAIAAAHGGLLKHSSLTDLMERVGNAVDRATLQGLFDQLGVLQTALHAEKGREMADVLRKMVGYLDAALGALPKPAGNK
ncbi:hypothetical protein LA080_006518 [Diaporthe eres]|nr:hypothetical protein LA080_006518 [Diaporthe eres]